MNAAIDLEENLTCQHRLAMSLASSLGHEAAIRACLQMHWYGVLVCFLNEKTEPSPFRSDQT